MPLITPANGAVPLGRTNATYTCLHEGQFQQWLLIVPSLGSQLALVPGGTQVIADVLGSKGLGIAPGIPNVLLINATIQVNASTIQCTVIVNGMAINSEPVLITVFGTLHTMLWCPSFIRIYMLLDRPDRPVVNYSALGAGRLLFTWGPAPSLSPTNITYSFSVTDSAVPSVTFFEVGSLLEPRYEYVHSTGAAPALCGRYQFVVVAKNDAGESNHSQPIVASLPTGTYIHVNDTDTNAHSKN